MKKRRLFILLILLLSAAAAGYFIFKDRRTGSAQGARLSSLSLIVEDSIPLFNDSLSFSFANLQKCGSDSILAFQYPILNLSLLDGKGNFRREITRRGELKEQFTSAFINTCFAKDGRLYVLEEGNAPRLRIFDKNLNYLNSINLADKLGNHYIPTLSSYFYIDFPADSAYDMVLHTSIGSTLYHTSSKKLYEQDSSFASVFIKNNEVRKVIFSIPLAGFATVKEALKTDRKSWDSPNPVLKYNNGFFYVKYEFDDSVYLYNAKWERLKAYCIGSSSGDRNFATKFEPIMDLTKSIASDLKVRYSNRYYFSMDIYGDNIYLLYYKPSDPARIPANLPEEQKYQPQIVLHQYNMTNGREATCELPGYISPYTKLFINNEGDIYLLGNNKIQEDINVYKFSVK